MRGARRLATAATATAAALLLAGCTPDDDTGAGAGEAATETAVAIGVPTPVGTPAPEAPVSDVVVPYAFSEAVAVEPGWTAAPLERDGVFIGTSEGDSGRAGSVEVSAVDSAGTVLWRTTAPLGTTVTPSRTADGTAIVALTSDTDPAPPTSLLVDLQDGSVVAGPLELPGPLVGPGLVVDDGGARLALDPATGQPRTDTAPAADEVVVAEDDGTVLLGSPGALRAVGPEGADLWELTAADLGLDPGATPTAVRGAQAPQGTAVVGTEQQGALVDLTSGTIEAVDVRDARRDVSMGHLVALGERTVSAHRAGEVLWSGPAEPDARLAAVGGALVYLREGEAVRVVNSLTGAHAEAWDEAADVSGGLGVPAVMSSKGAAALRTDRWVVLTAPEG